MNLDEYEAEVNHKLRNKLQAMAGNCRQCSAPDYCECRNKVIVEFLWEWVDKLTCMRAKDLKNDNPV